MQFFIIILILGLVVFMFSLFMLSHDDFVLLRKNVSMDKVFNIAFITALISLLFSRIFYVASNPEPVFFSPLGFMVFPYFPGLSVVGGVIGSLIYAIILSRNKELPI